MTDRTVKHVLLRNGYQWKVGGGEQIGEKEKKKVG
jgi:hypothetical protein